MDDRTPPPDTDSPGTLSDGQFPGPLGLLPRVSIFPPLVPVRGPPPAGSAPIGVSLGTITPFRFDTGGGSPASGAVENSADVGDRAGGLFDCAGPQPTAAAKTQPITNQPERT